MPQSIGDINASCFAIERHAGGPLQTGFRILSANRPEKPAPLIKHINLVALGVGYINIIVGITSHIDGRLQPFVARPIQKLILPFFEIKNMNSVRARIRNQQAAVTVMGNRIGTEDLRLVLIRTSHPVDHLRKESPRFRELPNGGERSEIFNSRMRVHWAIRAGPAPLHSWPS